MACIRLRKIMVEFEYDHKRCLAKNNEPAAKL
jgi:hypothetical protein